MAAAGFVYPMANKLDKYEIVTESGCWIWLGATNADGYGVVAGSHHGVRWRIGAHRASFELHIGPIPEGLQVLHRCDVPCCINPYHLFVGTHLINMEDRQRKGRTKIPDPRYGEANPMHGMTGPKNHFFGRTHSEESKMKISETKRLKLVK